MRVARGGPAARLASTLARVHNSAQELARRGLLIPDERGRDERE